MKKLCILMLLLIAIWTLPIQVGFFLCTGPGGCFGSNNADLMVGDGSDNSFLAEAGNDSLFGLEGRDALHADPGHDILFGGLGSDNL